MKPSKAKQWYQTLFENYAESYDGECFALGTFGECNFIESELAHDKSLKIIDVGCGTGRHAIELAKRGYNVTGIDLSENLLHKAREKAKAAGVKVTFLHQDARNLPFNNQFDGALMICEGAFPLMETDEMNFEILEGVTRALKPKAKFIFTTLNGLFPVFNSIDQFHEEGLATEGNATYKSTHFDIMTFRDHNITSFTDDHGVQHEIECNERYYLPCEITWLLKSLGYTKIEIFGCKLGAFSRQDNLTINDFEMLVVANKSAD